MTGASQMETAALVAPVTALEFIQDELLLSGEGPVLTVYSLPTCPKRTSALIVLQHQRIHGIRPRELQQGGQTNTVYNLAVFGGKAVRLVQLDVLDPPQLKNNGEIMELPDWILDIRWMSEDSRPLLCVALAHNAALLLDTETKTTIYHRSCFEGCLLYSALILPHKSWSNTVLIGGTVFNQLVVWKAGCAAEKSESKAPVERRLLGHSGVIFDISYFQKQGLLASASDDRSVRIWKVGNLRGQCGEQNPICLHVLYGHEARVFSVKLLDTIVVSAGEDGACLMWDNGKVVQTLKGHRAGGVRSLAVSSESWEKDVLVASGGADGGVRLWKLGVKQDRVEDIEENLKDLKFPVNIMDTKEAKKQKRLKSEKAKNPQSADFKLCESAVKTSNKTDNLKIAETLVDGQEVRPRNHENQEQSYLETTQALSNLDTEIAAEHTVKKSIVGVPKVICALDSENSAWNSCRFIVCTDKGEVYEYSNEKWQRLWQGTPEFQSYCVMEAVSVQMKDSLVHLCAVGNINGSVQIFPILNPKGGMCLAAGNGKIHSLIWLKGSLDAGAWLLASGGDGLVYRWYVEVMESENLGLKVEELISFEVPNCAKRWLTTAVRVELGEDAIWVCGDRRGSLLLYQEKGKYSKDEGLMQGSPELAESLTNKVIEASSKDMLKLFPVSTLFGVHGKQGVTSVVEHSGLFYSVGRDGCVRIFCSKVLENVESNVHPEQPIQEHVLEVLRVQRACKGMEWLEKILILETKTGHELVNFAEKSQESTELKQSDVNNICIATPQNVQEVRFAIVGFHGNHFVVWDPVRQERLLSVLCGGGHRSWSLWTDEKGHWTGNGALVFIKQGAVLASEKTLQEANGKIGWTLREGVHGRGIGCIHRLGCVFSQQNACWELVVTGGEDTSVTVLALNPKNGDMKVLTVLTDHISSVRALAAVVNKDGSRRALSALLVSAGGRAQMQCYRLLIGCNEQGGAPSCQVIQIAAHRLDDQWEKKRNRHKMVKMDPETRYMSMAVLEQTSDPVILAVACSDGAVRLFSVSEVDRRIGLLWESFHHQRCVLCVATCCLQDTQGNRHHLLLSAATDGQIALWNFTSFLLYNQFPPSPIFTVPAHQSGVNSMDILPLRCEDYYHLTIASGGDDGQLTVSQIQIQFIDDSDSQHQLCVSLVTQSHSPLAHAAPLTSLKLRNKNEIVSTSCDQRVCLWRFCSAGVIQQRAVCSHVADAAALSLWEGECESGSWTEGVFGEKSKNQNATEVCAGKLDTGERKDAYVLICGQGLQLIHMIS